MVKMFEVGMLATNCYVVSCRDTLETGVIDPGLEVKAKLTQSSILFKITV